MPLFNKKVYSEVWMSKFSSELNFDHVGYLLFQQFDLSQLWRENWSLCLFFKLLYQFIWKYVGYAIMIMILGLVRNEFINFTCLGKIKLMHYNYLYTLSSQYVCLQLLGHNGPFVGFYLSSRPAFRDKKFTAIFIQ